MIFVVPGRIDSRTGGYIYDRRMIEGLRQQGWPVEVRELDASFPFPTSAALEHAAGVFAAAPDGTLLVVDGLALSAMPDLIENQASRLKIAALVHLPLTADVGLDPDTAAALAPGERRALAASRLVIVTGAAALPMLAGYSLPRDRIVVVEPGTDRAPLARGSGGPLVQLLCVATLGPGKGHELLLRALAETDASWHLTCAGSTIRHPPTVERVRTTARHLKLDDRVSMVGELDDLALADCYDRSDVFVLATLQESYGMAVAEALARGLPVVATVTGAIPDLVGDAAGLLVPPGNTAELADALARVVRDAGLRARFAAGARRVRDRLPRWEHACASMTAALARLDTNG